MKKYNYIFFDLDHTLWDFDRNSTEVLEELYEVYALHRYPATSSTRFISAFQRINTALWTAFEQGLIPHQHIRENRFKIVLEELGIPDTSPSLRMNDDFLDRLPLKSNLIYGARDILDFATDQGYILNIITNGFAKVQESKLMSSGIRHYFHHVITHEAALANKPDARIFNYAMNLAGAEVSNCLMVGDSWNADVIGAANVGMDVAFFNPLNLKSSDKATYQFRELRELMNFL